MNINDQFHDPVDFNMVATELKGEVTFLDIQVKRNPNIPIGNRSWAFQSGPREVAEFLQLDVTSRYLAAKPNYRTSLY
jgi:hypothetical protein